MLLDFSAGRSFLEWGILFWGHAYINTRCFRLSINFLFSTGGDYITSYYIKQHGMFLVHVRWNLNSRVISGVSGSQICFLSHSFLGDLSNTISGHFSVGINHRFFYSIVTFLLFSRGGYISTVAPTALDSPRISFTSRDFPRVAYV